MQAIKYNIYNLYPNHMGISFPKILMEEHLYLTCWISLVLWVLQIQPLAQTQGQTLTDQLGYLSFQKHLLSHQSMMNHYHYCYLKNQCYHLQTPEIPLVPIRDSGLEATPASTESSTKSDSACTSADF